MLNCLDIPRKESTVIMNNTISQDMNREDNGNFAIRYDEPKTLRSMRLTDYAWNTLKELGDKNTISRSDVIERLTRDGKSHQKVFLDALNTFIEDEKEGYRNSDNPMQKGEFKFSRSWDKLLKFKDLIENAPWEVLGEE